MPLRSGKKYLKKIFPVEEKPFRMILLPEKKIDFDNATKLWRQNKNYLGEGRFEYKDNLSA